MENKHRKSKRSLRGEDVYELACRYDVGWSIKKQKIKAEPVEVKVEGSQASGTNETQSEERNKTNSEEHHDSAGPKVEDTEFNVHEIINDNNSNRQLQKVNRDANLEQNDLEQDLNPLHTKWTFTREERAKLKSQGVKLKMGSWSKKEINQLEENMKNYLKENNITDPTPLILAENGRRGKTIKARCSQTNFYRSLGKGIHRPLFYIYRRVLRMYNPENHLGRYTEAESQEILRYHAIYGDKWAKIGSLIGRSGNSVHHHYLDIQKTRAGSWSEKEIERLNAAVRATTGTDFGVQICRGICWTEVASLVITRTADQCRGKWMTDVCWRTTSGEKNVKWDSEDDVKLIQRLYSAVETDENDIDWVSITKDLPNAPSVTWLRTQWLTLKKVVPDYTECDYEEILDYLYNTHRPSVMKRKTEDTQNS